MINLEAITKVNGWERLSDQQKNILFIVMQDHAKVSEAINPTNVIKVTAGDHANQVHAHYKSDWFHYEIDSKSGRSIWF